MGRWSKCRIFKLNVVSGGLLVEADDVSCRVAEPGSDLGCVRADWLHDFAAMGDDDVNGGGHTVNHDVKQQAGLGGGRTAEHPRAAHFAGSIVKSGATVAAFADVPAEDAFIEIGRARNVGGGHFDVTDFTVGKFGRHGHSSPGAAILAARFSVVVRHSR